MATTTTGSEQESGTTIVRPFAIIHNGSRRVQAGFAGEPSPSAEFPSTVGRPKQEALQVGTSASAQENLIEDRIYVGEEARAKREYLALNHPVQKGLVEDWEDMERIWHHTFHNVLHVPPEDCPVLLTEVPLNRRSDREKTAQIMFETFKVPKLFIAMQAVLSLYASGRKTGVVLDVGDSVTHVVPVNVDGYAITDAILNPHLTGHDLTKHILSVLAEKGISFSTRDPYDQQETVREIKEKLCFVAKDYTAELAKEVPPASEELKKASYKLPDGQIITLGPDRFRSPEILFNPAILLSSPGSSNDDTVVPGAEGEQPFGLHKACYESIMKCDENVRKTLYGNIVLTGGTTLFPGFLERLNSEVSALAPSEVKVKVVGPRERKASAWIGGSILASLGDAFLQLCVSKEDYEEHGASIIHRVTTR